jgi:thiamine kinase-like enzyme
MNPLVVAAEVLGVSANSLQAERIKGGLTNESWSVRNQKDAVVVRISTADEHALQLNRVSETVVLGLAQQAGIGAEVLLCAPERRLLVTKQLQATTLSVSDMHDRRTLQQLTTLLQKLHSLSVPTAVQRTDWLAILHSYWTTLGERADAALNVVGAQDLAMEIATESTQQSGSCLCHNDVHHLNLMADGQRLWLLDWEYAGVGDPLFDLAAVCCYHHYDQSLRDQLLLLYRGELLAAERARLQRMCWLFDYIKSLWLQVRGMQTED